MNCTQACNLFDAYLDGELTGSLAAEFGAHHLACADCRRELALLEVTGHVIASDTDMPLLSSEFTERLLQCAVAQPAGHRTRTRWLIWSIAPVAAAAACLAIFFWPGDTPTSAPAPDSLVAGHVENISDEELLQRVETALSQDPDNARLLKLAEELKAKGRRALQQTLDGANTLENYGKETIMDVLRSIRVVSPPIMDGKEQPKGTSGNEHESKVQPL